MLLVLVLLVVGGSLGPCGAVATRTAVLEPPAQLLPAPPPTTATAIATAAISAAAIPAAAAATLSSAALSASDHIVKD